MGLLEKAQERVLAEKNTSTKQIEKEVKKESKASGLLEKAKQRKKIITEVVNLIDDSKLRDDAKKDIIEEKTGFGWRGLGIRRIVFNHDINEYVYEIIEPVLNDEEKDLKEELSRLFKMLADVNITDMNKKDKEKYLEETLEQIIIDNDIKFYGHKLKKEEKDKKTEKENKDKTEGKKTLANLFSKNKKDEKINLLVEVNKPKTEEKKNSLKNFFKKKSKEQNLKRKIESEKEKQNKLQKKKVKKERVQQEKVSNKKEKSFKNLFSKKSKEEKTESKKMNKRKIH